MFVAQSDIDDLDDASAKGVVLVLAGIAREDQHGLANFWRRVGVGLAAAIHERDEYDTGTAPGPETDLQFRFHMAVMEMSTALLEDAVTSCA
ncbi:MAG: hypothetical protein JWR83_377 [Aeromicrobium sp.]|nr:hypothetical protein [Aeromicrobium sp.]